jgi:hypothetical protein
MHKLKLSLPAGTEPAAKNEPPPPRMLPIAQLRLDGGTQTRMEINEQVVRDYAEVMAAAEDGANAFPSIVVYEDSEGSHWLADGFHRVRAAQRNGQTEIKAEVRTGSRLDAFVFSLGANKAHGLRRTNADKRHSITLALKEPLLAAQTSCALAELCGVHHDLVERVRREMRSNDVSQLAESANCPPEALARRRGRDGKWYAPRVRQRDKPSVQTQEEPDHHSGDKQGDKVPASPLLPDGLPIQTGELGDDVAEAPPLTPPESAQTPLESQKRGVSERIDAEPFQGAKPAEGSLLEDPALGRQPAVSCPEEAEGLMSVEGLRLPPGEHDRGPILFDWLQGQLNALKECNERLPVERQRDLAALRGEQTCLIELARTSNRLLGTLESSAEPPMALLNDALFQLRNFTHSLLPTAR